MTVFIEATGIKEYKRFLEQFPEVAPRAASIALNQTTERTGMRLARTEMLRQIAFPTGYLAPPRFSVTRKASPSNLLSVMSGQFTPTPLARFAGAQRSRFVTARTQHRKTPRPTIRVQIKPGHIVELPRAFFVNLKNGNVGIGIRLKPGEALLHTIGARVIASGPLKGVALLYGPSVDQVFRTVAADITPDLLLALDAEFYRQFARMVR